MRFNSGEKASNMPPMRTREKYAGGSIAAAWRALPRALASLALAMAIAMAIAAAPARAAAPSPDKDQSRIGGGDRITPGGASPLMPGGPGLLNSPDAINGDNGGEESGVEGKQDALPHGDDEQPLDALIAEDIPNIRAIELEPRKAKKALEALEAVYGKYDDKGMNDYPTLQEFADKTEAGKKMQEEIRKFGFANVEEWNIVIMNIGFAYSALDDNSDEELLRQIREVENNGKLKEEDKKRMIANLRALIPSPNNRKVVRELLDDPLYARKLKLLDADLEEDRHEDHEDHQFDE